ncbi:MAG: lysophospholipid acyltransferase family protein [bacterium]
MEQTKPSSVPDNRKITAKKRGNAAGFWFFKTFMRLFGLRGAYGLLYVVCLYYLIFDTSAVSASSAYVERRFPGCGFFTKRLHIYRLFVNQGRQLIDLNAILSKEKTFDIKLQGYDHFLSLLQSHHPGPLPSGGQEANPRQGIILLTAHAGNWQLAMTSLGKMERDVYLLMRPEDNQALKNSLPIGEEQERIKFISPEQELGGILKIINVLKEGHIVSIMGDRSYGFKALEVSFLKERAWFPYGAFSIAAAVECPVVVLLSMKTKDKSYVIDVSNVLYPRYESGQNKTRQLQKWVQDYAAILDAYVDRYPYQCFLFHNVWQKQKG